MPALKYQSTSDPYFASIRPYLDTEVPDAIAEVTKEPIIQALIEQLDLTIPEGITSVTQFKKEVIWPAVTKIMEKSTFSYSASGRSHLANEEGYLFISNHRDIVMDSVFINISSAEEDKLLSRIAIGDNLLITDWITSLVRLADAFMVIRKPSIRETLEESKRLSHYIRTTLLQNESSVWIAQREGRTKDANDTTQTSILKMLAMSAEDTNDYIEALEPLKITPVAISYEYDPCDYLKAKELLQRDLDPKFTKSPMDDLLSMEVGIFGYKGRVHTAYAEPLTDIREKLQAPIEKRADQLAAIATLIDRAIHQHYRIYPNNYIAYDLLHGSHRFEALYSEKEHRSFVEYIDGQIEKIVMTDKDEQRLKELMLTMYANPLINQMKQKEQL